jgi:Rha family phage regulatory protein
MNTQIQIIASSDNTLVTTSHNIADVFSKRHDDLLKAINNLIIELPQEWRVRNFAESSKSVDMPNGGTREQRFYNITRDGFTLLAMGFTGKKALAFKLAYIDQFNKMEKALLSPVASLGMVQDLNTKVAEIESHYQRQLAHIRQENTDLYRQLITVQKPVVAKALPSLSQAKARQHQQDAENAFIAKVKTVLDSEGALIKTTLLEAAGKEKDDKTARALLDKFDGVIWQSNHQGNTIVYTLMGGAA